ncbi:MAG: GH1 family beta-glucosidase [Sphaerochaetaceae bacterium]|nr:GH1 family beta-glucosidase [Sphaerochaetaceae bacterium]
MYKEFIKFPKDFKFGVSTASFQIEGGALEDGKGKSIWDEFSSHKNNIADGCNGEITCDHFHKWDIDLDIMKSLGIKNYRFSIAWTRIFPTGKIESYNEKGMLFYENLIKEMLKRGITPYVTLFHWDLPLELQKKGGFNNKQTIEDFLSYSKTVIDRLSPLVKNWMTFNEPWVFSFCGHLFGNHAPGLKDLKTALAVTHNILLAHAKTVEYVKNNYSDLEIGIVNNLEQIVSASDKEEDIQAAKRWNLAFNSWYLDPLFKGEYPKELVQYYTNHLDENNNIENVMIEYSDEEMKFIQKNCGDFLGINYYTRRIIAFDSGNYHLQAKHIFRPTIKRSNFESWEVNPEAFYDLLIDVKKQYGDIKIYISESGTCGDDFIGEDGCVHDEYRIEYLRRHFAAVQQAIVDGVNIKGYFVWSLLDNFEWGFGFTKRFGIVFTDYEDNQNRIIKDSGHFLSHVIRKNGFIID